MAVENLYLLHRANAEELADIAQQMGASVLRGGLTYPSENGGFALGGLELGEYLYELRGQELILIVMPLGQAAKLATICGLCMTPFTGDECPTCREEREEAKRVIERRLREAGKLDRARQILLGRLLFHRHHRDHHLASRLGVPLSLEETTRFIEEHGGKVTSSVSTNTDYLLVGENPGGTKYSRAQELGVPMVDEDRLRRMTGG